MPARAGMRASGEAIMSTVTDAIRKHHRELGTTLAGYARALEQQPDETDPAALVAFLQGELLPHAHGEERTLYPAVNTIMQAQRGVPTATMSVDHVFIEDYVRRLDETARSLAAAGPEQRAGLRRELARLAGQLEALLRLHTEKEDRVYLPLVERYLPLEEQQHLLDEMHAPEAHEVGTHQTAP
jgi:hemerythrin-like domain-containing protein